MSRLLHFFTLACTAIAFSGPGVALAQGDAMIELYGEGVHRFNNADFLGADELLSQVIDSGSLDARAFYFRGLAREMQGFDSQADFETGALYEAEGRRVVQVGLALVRVQGALRSKIEEARRAARVQVLQQKMAQQAERRKMMPQVDPKSVPATPAVTDDPFTGDGMTSGDKTPAVVDAKDDPFADDPVQPEAAPFEGADPFSEDPAPAAEAPATTPTDPFGEDAGAADPFSDPAGDADPFDTGAADPFGGASDASDPF